MRNAAKWGIVAAFAAATAAWIFMDHTSVPVEEPVAIANQKIVPDTELILLNGGKISLHSLKGKTVWLHFWASWCAPCREEFSVLLARLQKEDNTVLLAVSGDANADDAKRFIAPYALGLGSDKMLVAIDSSHRIIEGTFQTFQYPETIIISPDLVMERKIAGIFKE